MTLWICSDCSIKYHGWVALGLGDCWMCLRLNADARRQAGQPQDVETDVVARRLVREALGE